MDHPTATMDRGDSPAAAPPRTAATAAGIPFGTLPPCPNPLRSPLRAIAWLLLVGAGLASLLLILAILAAIPIANLLALGTMLEAEGRVVRSGRLRDGIPFAGALPRLGAIVLGVWFWLLVVRIVTQAAADARLVDPGGPAARGWALARLVAVIFVGWHVVAACHDGGRLSSFFRPLRTSRRLVASLRSGRAWSTAAESLRQAIDGVAPGRLFSLGLRGFVGAFLWLLLPTILFSALRDTTAPASALVTLLGAGLLAVVLAWVPFLQARFAAEDRIAVFRDAAWAREMWRRAPIAMLVALVLLYGLSLPLFLLKVIAAPRDAVLLLTPIFILTIYPARIAVAWATHRAMNRRAPGWLLVRWPVTAVLVPLLLLYLFLLFFTPAIGAFGRRTLFDHHAILLPTPF